jgi:hypothetical protein
MLVCVGGRRYRPHIAAGEPPTSSPCWPHHTDVRLGFQRTSNVLKLARLLNITMNNRSIPCDWKKSIVVPIYSGGDRSIIGNYRPISLTSVVCNQMKQVLAGYLWQIWE